METKKEEISRILQDFNRKWGKSYVNKVTNRKSTRSSAENVNKRVDNVDNLFLNEVFADIYNISGPHSY